MVSEKYPSWLEEIKEHDKSSRLKQAIATQARWFYYTKETRNFSRLNSDLQLIEIKTYSSTVLVGFIRGSVNIKCMLPYWECFFLGVRLELLQRGEDVGTVLTGI